MLSGVVEVHTGGRGKQEEVLPGRMMGESSEEVGFELDLGNSATAACSQLLVAGSGCTVNRRFSLTGLGAGSSGSRIG